MPNLHPALTYALLAACLTAAGGCAGPSPGTRAAAQGGNGNTPLIYLASRQSPGALERCLLNRVPQERAAHAGATTLFVGPEREDADWIVTLQDNGAGTNLSVYAPRNGDSGVPEEPELRFDIARCAV